MRDWQPSRTAPPSAAVPGPEVPAVLLCLAAAAGPTQASLAALLLLESKPCGSAPVPELAGKLSSGSHAGACLGPASTTCTRHQGCLKKLPVDFARMKMRVVAHVS